jgi:superfamily II DNA or RNA helicase
MSTLTQSNRSTFLDPGRLGLGGPYAFARAGERLLMHLDFGDIRNIDGAGDEGGDILASRAGVRWIFQSKWSSKTTIDRTAVEQADAAKAFYRADRAAFVTNAAESPDARRRRDELDMVGSRVTAWQGRDLDAFATKIPDYAPARIHNDTDKPLHPYQTAAVSKARVALERDGRALVVLATGLGKTVVAGDVIHHHLCEFPDDDVLVVADKIELVKQLERALWKHLPKQVPTQVLNGDRRPPTLQGVTCATVKSAVTAVEDGYQPGLVVVDEAHHVGETGDFQKLLDMLPDARQIGVTATPWRGDGYDVAERFGRRVFRMGIADGMAAGFLAQVDYRLLLDEDIDWDAIAQASQQGLTVKDLNSRLFLPQRDESIIEKLRDVWDRTPEPRAIVFSRTINHAEEFAQLLRERGWPRAEALSTRQSKRERNVLMSEFSDGRVPIITAVDVLNEGVDVPDVNILCFLRVTHSRRIFIQQLGRGLRVRPGKERVTVLDFVSDIRRVAATRKLEQDIDTELKRLRDQDIERLQIPDSTFEFDRPEVGSLMEEWIRDAASLEDADEEARLQFPIGYSPD